MTLTRLVQLGRALGQSAPVASVALLAANAVPLLGVLFLGWDATTILLLFWVENGIVGLLNVPKILLTGLGTSGALGRGQVLYSTVFFPIHYGFFWYGHGFFLLLMTGRGRFVPFDVPSMLGAVLADPAVLAAALGLLASHVVSLLANYVGRREYLRTTANRQLFAPYPRMVILHLTVIFGGLLVIEAEQPIGLLVALVAFKTAVDLLFHLREHRRRPPADRAAESPAAGMPYV